MSDGANCGVVLWDVSCDALGHYDKVQLRF